MKKLALATAGIFLLAPANADASQSTPPSTAGASKAAPAQSADEPATAQVPAATAKAAEQADEPAASQAPPAATTGGQTAGTCVSPGKASASAHPSAKVGKDTGELPPPRKKASTDCPSQPNH